MSPCLSVVGAGLYRPIQRLNAMIVPRRDKRLQLQAYSKEAVLHLPFARPGAKCPAAPDN